MCNHIYYRAYWEIDDWKIDESATVFILFRCTCVKSLLKSMNWEDFQAWNVSRCFSHLSSAVGRSIHIKCLLPIRWKCIQFYSGISFARQSNKTKHFAIITLTAQYFLAINIGPQDAVVSDTVCSEQYILSLIESSQRNKSEVKQEILQWEMMTIVTAVSNQLKRKHGEFLPIFIAFIST